MTKKEIQALIDKDFGGDVNKFYEKYPTIKSFRDRGTTQDNTKVATHVPPFIKEGKRAIIGGITSDALERDNDHLPYYYEELGDNTYNLDTDIGKTSYLKEARAKGDQKAIGRYNDLTRAKQYHDSGVSRAGGQVTKYAPIEELKNGGTLPKYNNGTMGSVTTSFGDMSTMGKVGAGVSAGTQLGAAFAPLISQAGTDSESGLVNPGAAALSTGLQGASMGAQLGSVAGPWGTVIGGGIGLLGGAVAGGALANKQQNEYEEAEAKKRMEANTLEASNIEETSKNRAAMITGMQMQRPATSIYQSHYGAQQSTNPFYEDGGTMLNPVAEIETNEVVKAKDGTYLAKGATHENGGIEMAYDGGGNPVATNGGTLQKINDIGTDGPTEISSDNIFFSSEEWSKYKNA